MGIDMPDFGVSDFSDNEVGAPGIGITMPDFGVDDWMRTLVSGDKTILTNGLGIYAAMIVP